MEKEGEATGDGGGKTFREVKKAKEIKGRKEDVTTVASLQVYVELIPWTAAALVSFRQVRTDVGTAVIHHGARILRCRAATWTENQTVVYQSINNTDKRITVCTRKKLS